MAINYLYYCLPPPLFGHQPFPTPSPGHFFLGLASVHNDEVRSPLTENVATVVQSGERKSP